MKKNARIRELDAELDEFEVDDGPPDLYGEEIYVKSKICAAKRSVLEKHVRAVGKEEVDYILDRHPKKYFLKGELSRFTD